MTPFRPGVRSVPEGRFAFGLQLPVAAQSRVFAAPWEASAGVPEIRRIAEACDRSGFFYVAVSDHVAVPREAAAAMSTVWYDSVATLGFLAASTQRVRLLSYVYVLPYRHPLAAAKAFATVDALSSGRVMIGIGAGHLEGEFDALDIPFRGRGRKFDEAIELLARALSEEFPTHEGEHWSIRDLGVAPRPVQSPRPPIWIGGSNPAALRRAADLGDGWLPQGTDVAKFPAQIETIREHRRRVHGELPIEIGANAPWMYVGRPSFDVPSDTRIGAPEALAEPIRELRRMGADLVGVRFRSRSVDELEDQIEAFGREVAPLVAESDERPVATEGDRS